MLSFKGLFTRLIKRPCSSRGTQRAKSSEPYTASRAGAGAGAGAGSPNLLEVLTPHQLLSAVVGMLALSIGLTYKITTAQATVQKDIELKIKDIERNVEREQSNREREILRETTSRERDIMQETTSREREMLRETLSRERDVALSELRTYSKSTEIGCTEEYARYRELKKIASSSSDSTKSEVPVD